MHRLKNPPLDSNPVKVNYFIFAARGFGALGLFVAELILLTVRFDTYQELPHPIYGLFAYSSDLLKLGISMTAAAVLLSVSRRKQIFSIIDDHQLNSGYLFWLITHLTLTSVFYYLTWILFEDIPNRLEFDGFNISLYGIAWLSVGLASFSSLLLVFANRSFWITLIRSEYKTLIVAFMVAALMQVAAFLFREEAWQPLTKITFELSSQILGFFFNSIVCDPVSNLLGTEHFQVQISSKCSGYEGMGLITAFLGLYIWIFRHQLRFPQVYLLFPFGILAIWLLNVIRIVALIGIGDLISPKLAIGGFHSTAGWIAFIGLSLFLVYVCQNLSIFKNKAQTLTAPPAPSDTSSIATALLMPFVVLLSVILVLSAITEEFDWFYPLKVVAGGIALWRFRHIYRQYLRNVSYQPLVIGAFVFVLWIWLVSISEIADQHFADNLFSQDSAIIYAWLLFRVIGTTLTVPIIEELAFRGYLLAKLVDIKFESVTPGSFTWFSFICSSLVFGVLHHEWLAGSLAGMLYAYAYYRRKALIDAVIAHMITNLLLSIYVLSTGHWSLW